MKTTFRTIKKYDPCIIYGWNKLVSNLKPENLDTEVSLEQILKSNGIHHAIWALRCFDYKDRCLFLADVAESVVHFYEKEYPDNKSLRVPIQAIRDFAKDKINEDDLGYYKDAALNCIPVGQLGITDKYGVCMYAVSTVIYAATTDSFYNADIATAYAVSAAKCGYLANIFAEHEDNTCTKYIEKTKWHEIEQLFIKHFC